MSKSNLKAAPAVNTSTPNIYEKLANVQAELKVPKNQYNKFGKYKFRNKEDILEAAKPLCLKNNLLLRVIDDMMLVGGRYYIQSAAIVTDMDTGDSLSSSGWAREAESQKGMDAAQLTGSTSSYAGKYALSNLFGIDDTKDSDATNTHGKEAPAAPAKKAAPAAQKAKVELTDGDKKILLNAIQAGKSAAVAKRVALFADGPNKTEVVEALKKIKKA